MSLVLVLAHPWDRGGAAVVNCLAGRRMPRPAVLVTPMDLVTARWHHRVGRRGATTTVTLRTGFPLGDSDVSVVLYRVEGFALPSFAASTPRDREYALAEFQALVASWLKGLASPIINPICGVGAARLSRRRWMVAAAAHGLPVATSVEATSRRALVTSGPSLRPGGTSVGIDELVALDSSTSALDRLPVVSRPTVPLRTGTVLITGDRATGPLAREFGEACAAVSADAGRPHVCFRFAAGPDGWALTGVEDPPVLAEDGSVVAAADHLAHLATAHTVSR